MQIAKIIFVQSNPSQLDGPFYERLAEMCPGKVKVVLWNDFGTQRVRPDPEMGIVPVFPKLTAQVYEWIDRSKVSGRELARILHLMGAGMVVLQDQPWKDRAVIATALRAKGVNACLRSDKNFGSETARTGALRTMESLLVKLLFNQLAPISEHTQKYYSWPSEKAFFFPYPTDEHKFAPPVERRNEIAKIVRERLGIASHKKVVLAVKKFHRRESPHLLLEAMSRLDSKGEYSLILVGDGPLRGEVEARVKVGDLPDTQLTGYVPYSTLQDYFFAADMFVHVPEVGPWEISVTDALIAGLKVVTTDNVGAAVACMAGTEADKYLCNRDASSIANAINEAFSADAEKAFDVPRTIAERKYSVAAVTRIWADLIAGR